MICDLWGKILNFWITPVKYGSKANELLDFLNQPIQ